MSRLQLQINEDLHDSNEIAKRRNELGVLQASVGSFKCVHAAQSAFLSDLL